jgi:two-component system response regulator HydG
MRSAEIDEGVLVVDDSPKTLEILRRNLESEGYRVFTASGVDAAIGILESTRVDLVITDLKMPGASGLDLIRHVRENLRDTEVMMITGYASIEGAVKAVKSGAENYLSKPFTNGELATAVRRALDKLRMRKLGRVDVGELEHAAFGLIGESETMQQVYRAIERAATVSATVLITGESGTGKELVARAIHYNSARASAPFVAVNCGGIPDTLIESELFGHVKGAFTGATDSRAGFFQTADGGTIFLDEISDVSASMQAKLLRVLQEKEVCMVGASNPRNVDVRILAATNRDLSVLVKKGDFREDLFFRLNVIAIDVPPLRERGDDVLLLTRHFATAYAVEFGKPEPTFSENALLALRKHHWPGNVRELQNVVQRLVVMTDGDEIEVPDLPSLMRFTVAEKHGPWRTLGEVEVEHIRNVLASVDGNKTRAAEILGIDRKTLREKLKKTEQQD